MVDVAFKSIFDVPDDFTGRCIIRNNVHWYLNSKHHRIDGPAIEWANGSKAWYLNGEPHRIDGPAVERVDGTKEWWFNYELYGEDNDFTNESWILFQRTLLF